MEGRGIDNLNLEGGGSGWNGATGDFWVPSKEAET
jgi:hypothetical protein